MKIHIRYLESRRGKQGRPRWLWNPSQTDKARGWKAVALKTLSGEQVDQTTAISQALWLNAIRNAWSANNGELVAVLLEAVG